MAETRIAWTGTKLSDGTFLPGFTFNPWTGCLRVSPGCDNCYAASFAKRNRETFGSWEPGAVRKRTSTDYWRKPFAWNRAAERDGVRRRVFCASMADVFDNQAPPEWRDELWETVRATPSLDWLLLTKRPQNIADMLPPDWRAGYRNVWLGTTAENQTELDRRWPHLASVPSTIRFLSCEPLLGPLTLPLAPDWVIVGGESGGKARLMERHWAADVILQARENGAAPFFKQIGSKHAGWGKPISGKGDDPAEWPPYFRVQEFPHV